MKDASESTSKRLLDTAERTIPYQLAFFFHTSNVTVTIPNCHVSIRREKEKRENYYTGLIIFHKDDIVVSLILLRK